METRKNDHLSHALSFHSGQNSDWDAVKLPLSSFPELRLEEISLQTDLMGFSLETPFFINAMTGGSGRAKEINRNLAILARECNLIMATGSYSIALKNPQVRDSFTIIREVAPDILLGTNLGADKSLADAERAVEELGADFLQIHVNAMQEMIMPEGVRDFHGWLLRIQEIKESLDIPVMVKQVGFGMTVADLVALKNIGIRTVDLGGSGGTNFARIENARREIPFSDWNELGISTVDALRLSQPFQKEMEIIASGGMKSPLHIAKAISMGAKAVGVAGQFLFLLERDGLERTIEIVRAWKEELKGLYLLCGVQNTDALRQLKK